MADYTEEELAKLSPTEREALTAEGTDDDETLADIADDSDDDQDDDKPADDADASDDQTADDQAAADDKDDKDDQAADAADEGFDLNAVPVVSFTPKLSGEILPEFEAKIEALDVQLDAGDISASEHRREVRKLEAASQNMELEGQQWAAEQAAFFRANPNYIQGTNPVLWGTLNQELLRVGNDPANAHLSGIQNLYLAKANVEKAFKAMFPGAEVPGADKKQATDKKAVPPKPKVGRPDHQTLRDTPAADSPEVGQDKFAHLDKLSGLKLEAAISALSDADKQAYLSGV